MEWDLFTQGGNEVIFFSFMPLAENHFKGKGVGSELASDKILMNSDQNQRQTKLLGGLSIILISPDPPSLPPQSKKDFPLQIGLQPMNSGSLSPLLATQPHPFPLLGRDFSSPASQGPASSIRSIHLLELEGEPWSSALVVWHQCLEEFLFHPLNPGVEVPRDKEKSGANFIHTHHPFKTWIQDPQLMPSSMPGGSEVRYISEG